MKKALIIFFLFFSSNVMGQDINIKMLNKLDKELMVFSKKIVNINVGDTVFWEATDKGHNVEFIKKWCARGCRKI